MKMRIIGAAALLLAPTATALAQDSTDVIQLNEIVVTATRVSVPARTVATTVITGSELREMGVVQVQDAIRLTSAAVVATNSFGSLTSVFLRGGESGYTRVLVDGVPVNDPGGTFNFAHLLAADVERIEIAKGPTSVLYGTDAVSGVIQIFTRRGTARPTTTIAARGGNYGSYSASANIAGRTDGADYGLTIGQYRTDGISAFNNSYRNSFLSGSVAFRPDGASDIRVSLRLADRRYETPTDGSGNVVDRNAFEFGEISTVGIQAGRDLNERLSVHLTLANLSSNGGFDDAADNLADSLGFFGFRTLDKVVRRSGDGSINYAIPGGPVVTIGGHVEEEQQRSFNQSLSEFGNSNSLLDVSRWNRAGYAQVAGAVDKVSIQLGARFDHNQAFGDFFTYRLGAAYPVLPATSLRAALGTAFREPTFLQNFATGFVIGNPDLDPERTTSWEVGLDQSFLNGRGSLGATWFNQDFKDLIEFTFATAGPADPNYFNVAGARSRGLEITGLLGLWHGLTARAAYTYTDTRVTDEGFNTTPLGSFAPGERLLRRPEHTGSLTVSYASPRTTFHVTGNYMGARPDLDFAVFERVTLDSYATVDVAATVLAFESSERSIKLELRVANVFDESYEAVRGFATPGRNFMGGFSVGL